MSETFRAGGDLFADAGRGDAVEFEKGGGLFDEDVDGEGLRPGGLFSQGEEDPDPDPVQSRSGGLFSQGEEDPDPDPVQSRSGGLFSQGEEEDPETEGESLSASFGGDRFGEQDPDVEGFGGSGFELADEGGMGFDIDDAGAGSFSPMGQEDPGGGFLD